MIILVYRPRESTLAIFEKKPAQNGEILSGFCRKSPENPARLSGEICSFVENGYDKPVVVFFFDLKIQAGITTNEFYQEFCQGLDGDKG